MPIPTDRQTVTTALEGALLGEDSTYSLAHIGERFRVKPKKIRAFRARLKKFARELPSELTMAELLEILEEIEEESNI